MKKLTASFQGYSTLGNLTPGKEYNVIEVRDGGFGIVDDEGDEIEIQKHEPEGEK